MKTQFIITSTTVDITNDDYVVVNVFSTLEEARAEIFDLRRVNTDNNLKYSVAQPPGCYFS